MLAMAPLTCPLPAPSTSPFLALTHHLPTATIYQHPHNFSSLQHLPLEKGPLGHCTLGLPPLRSPGYLLICLDQVFAPKEPQNTSPPKPETGECPEPVPLPAAIRLRECPSQPLS